MPLNVPPALERATAAVTRLGEGSLPDVMRLCRALDGLPQLAPCPISMPKPQVTARGAASAHAHETSEGQLPYDKNLPVAPRRPMIHGLRFPA